MNCFRLSSPHLTKIGIQSQPPCTRLRKNLPTQSLCVQNHQSNFPFPLNSTTEKCSSKPIQISHQLTKSSKHKKVKQKGVFWNVFAGQRMKVLLVVMTGIGFTLGVLFGLLLQLPIDTLPADITARSRRSLNKLQHASPPSAGFENPIDPHHVNNLPDWEGQIHEGSQTETNPIIEGKISSLSANKNQISHAAESSQSSTKKSKENGIDKQHTSDARHLASPSGFHNGQNGYKTGDSSGKTGRSDARVGSHDPEQMTPNSNVIVSKSYNLGNPSNNTEYIGKNRLESNDGRNLHPSIIRGIHWIEELESSCPNGFQRRQTDKWRRKAENMDVVKMEEGCGRMQNRLVTFRDSTKACARYRLNTDQIQGEVFSYYLARLLNISNIPPTVLALVDAVSHKWKTVHLDLSLAQWADRKLVVLTQFIEELSPAYIPHEFREDNRTLHPTLPELGVKSKSELCELVQWSDLIILDYLTANLDRVINNMFNRQWNDQMMNSPTHNLDKSPDGSLVFLDNESGLFHGYRLLDKYAGFHSSLLHSLCVFRPSTTAAIKRLHASRSIGTELNKMFVENESLHRHLAGIPDKNVKILQKRIDDVYEQIIRCEQLFSR